MISETPQEAEGEKTDARRRQDTEVSRLSEERFRLLVEGAHDYAMFLLDEQRRITFWSTGAARLFGWTESEALGRSSDFIFTPEDRQRGEPEREMETARTNGRAADRRWHVRKDGSRFWADGMLMRLEGVEDATTASPRFAKIARDATEQREAEDALRRAHDELEVRVAERTAEWEHLNLQLRSEAEQRRRLVEQLVNAQEEERRRLSRELHDQTGQLLTALMLRFKLLEERLPADSPLHADLLPIHEILHDFGRELHHLAVDLRPTALDDLGLSAALANYVEQWSERSGIPTDYHSGNEDEPRERLSMPVETALYRIAQEILTNVLKHAQARHVSVILERLPGQIQLIVEDDGVGFDAENRGSTLRPELGLLGMRERALMIGAELIVESTPGQGTSVFVRVPLPA